MSDKVSKKLVIATVIISIIAVAIWAIVISMFLKSNNKAISQSSAIEDEPTESIIEEETDYEDGEIENFDGNNEKSEEDDHYTDAQKQEKIEELMRNINKKYDDMQNITWYLPVGEQYYSTGTGEDKFELMAYIGESEGKHWIRLRCGFIREDWIFAEEILVKADNNRFSINFDYLKDRNGEVLYGGVREWIDISVDNELLSNLHKIINANESKIRFGGKTYYAEYIINEQQKEQLKTIIDYYELVK